MTAAELLKPRFEVIAEYPRCPFKKGTILKLISDLKLKDWYEDEEQTDMTKGIFIKPYPHLYNPLNWWEHRKVEDMPKKVVSLVVTGGKDKEEIITVDSWDMSNFTGIVNGKVYVSLTTWKPEFGYLPID